MVNFNLSLLTALRGRPLLLGLLLAVVLPLAAGSPSGGTPSDFVPHGPFLLNTGCPDDFDCDEVLDDQDLDDDNDGILDVDELDCENFTDIPASSEVTITETFGAGPDPGPVNPDVTNSYSYSGLGPTGDGSYSIATDSDLYDDFPAVMNVWLPTHGLGDATGDDNGYFLLVNGSAPGQEAYRKTFNIALNSSFSASLKILNLNPTLTTKPNLTIRLENSAGDLIAENNIGQFTNATWVTHTLTGSTLTDPQVDMVVISNSPGGSGNDYGIDDVSITYTPLLCDSDDDDSPDNLDLDADGDGCFDVTEAGFEDPDNDGFLGSGMHMLSTGGVDADGKVLNAGGYMGTTDAVTNDQICCMIDLTSLSVTDAGCDGGSNGTVTVVGTGAASIDYTLTESDGTVIETNQTGNFSGLAAGTYNVIISDAAIVNCMIEQEVMITDDTEAPQANCSSSGIGIDIFEETFTFTAEDLNDNSTDNCGTTNLSIEAGDQFVFTCADVGTSPTMTLIVDDGNGNSSSCDVTVNIEDGQSFCCPLTIDSATPTDPECPGINDGSIEVVATGAATINYTLTLNGSVVASNQTGTFTDLDPGTYTVTAADASNASCTDEVADIEITAASTDQVPPDAPTLSTLTDQCAVFVNTPTTTDNCIETVVGITSTDISGPITASTTITWVFSDGFNEVSVDQEVVINDVTSAQANCNATIQIPLNAETVTLTAADLDNNSFDNCGAAPTLAITDGQTTFGCDDVGAAAVTVTLSASDGINAATTCTSQVTVVAGSFSCNSAPTITCAAPTVNADANCMGAAAGAMFVETSDDPDGDELTISVSPEGPYELGETEVTVTADDGNGETATCMTTITVEDNTGPVLTDCPTGVIELDTEAGGCVATLADYAAGVSATDNCGSGSGLSAPLFASTGETAAAAIAADGTLWTWGKDTHGALGNGNISGDVLVPTQTPNGNDWASLDVGTYHIIGIKNNGTLWSWGSNFSKALGIGPAGNTHSPTQVGADTDWIQVSVGFWQSMGLKSDGSLYTWGSNIYGQQGQGTIGGSDVDMPQRVGADNDWAAIFSSYDYCFAIKTDGTLWAWGRNHVGQLGIGTTFNTGTPTQVGTDADWQSVGVGGRFHTIAVKTDGTLWSWGSNNYQALGTNGGNTSTPVQVGTDNTWSSVSAGHEHSVGIKTDGTLWTWGTNSHGALGIGTNSGFKTTPTQVGTDTDWVWADADLRGTIAGKADGSLHTFGQNSFGTIGDGTFNHRTAPYSINLSTTPVVVSSGPEIVQSPAPGGPLTVGAHTITISAEDAVGNSSNCTFTVTVSDNEAPVANCVADYTANLVGDGELIVSTSDLDNGSSDNCGNEVLTIEDGDRFNFNCDDVGTTQTVTLVVTAGGLSDQCDVEITITDDNSVCFTCDLGFTVEDEDNNIPPGIITSRVVCGDDGAIIVNAFCNGCDDGNTDLRYSIDGTNFQDGNVFSGLAAGEYTVTIHDVDNPDCSATATATIGECVGELPGNDTDDDCDTEADEPSSVAWVLLDGSAENDACTSATDLCGQTFCYGLEYTPLVSGTLTSYTTGFLLECVDGATPLLSNASCVMTDNSFDAADCAGGNGAFFNASGNSGGAAMVDLTKDEPIILHQICLTIPDATTLTLIEDAITDISMSITVAPILSTDDPILVTDFPDYEEAGFSAAGNYPPVVTAVDIDACYDDVATAEAAALAATTSSDDFTAEGDLVITVGTVGDCAAVITVSVEDECGLITEVLFGTRIDADAPVVEGTFTELTEEGCSAADVSDPATTVAALELMGVQISDNCSTDEELMVTSTETSEGTCPVVVTRVYTITDFCGKSITATQTINVDDTMAPTFTGALTMTDVEGCDVSVLPAAATTAADLEALAGDLDVSDICTADEALVITSVDEVDASTCPIVVTRTYTITDGCDNSVDVVHTLRVIDTVDPILTAGTLADCYAVRSEALQAAIDATTATDNCGLDVTLSATSTGSCPATITVTGVDACGNDVSIDYEVIITDEAAPTEVGGPAETSVEIQTTLDVAEPVAPVFEDVCGNELTGVGPVVDNQYTEGECSGTIAYTWTYTDCAGTESTWTFTYVVDCKGLELRVFTEGNYLDGTGMLSTSLNDNHLLPGQDKTLSPLVSIQVFADETPFGHPYQTAPWFYSDHTGAGYGDLTHSAAAGGEIAYPEHVVDWVLVTVRKDGIQPADAVWTCTGWVHETGEVTFPDACPITFDAGSTYHVIIEHRNHLPVMAEATLDAGATNITHDFTVADSYAPIFRFGQKQMTDGNWVMFTGNPDQTTSRVGINSADRTAWRVLQNLRGYYLGDFDQSLQVESNDETLWKNNQNKTSGIRFD